MFNLKIEMLILKTDSHKYRFTENFYNHMNLGYFKILRQFPLSRIVNGTMEFTCLIFYHI